MSGGSKFFRLQSSTPVKYEANLNAFQIKPSAGEVPEALGWESGVDGVAAAADSPGAHLKLRPTLVYGYCLSSNLACYGRGVPRSETAPMFNRKNFSGVAVMVRCKSCAMREVAVAASFEPHPNIIRLLDVHVQGKKVIPVYPLYPGTLAILARAPWSRRNSSI
jgi:hypothetical protein